MPIHFSIKTDTGLRPRLTASRLATIALAAATTTTLITAQPVAAHIASFSTETQPKQTATEIAPVVSETPVPVVVETTDRERIRGSVTGFTALELSLETEDGAQTVAWSDVRLRSAQQIVPRVIDAQRAEDWVVAGLAYRNIEGGSRVSEQAFERALRLNADLAEQVEALRQSATLPTDEAPTANGDDATNDSHDREQAGPQTLGEVPNAWPEMTDEQHAQFFERHDARYRGHLDEMGLNYQTLATDHFVVYSDLNPAVVRRYAALLERMYDRLVEMFSLEEDTRVYAGKAFVLICRSEQTYAAFNQRVYGQTAEGSLGVCWQSGSGLVQMSAWNDPEDPRAAARADRFLHTLVHENVHGFLFRYRSPEMIPNWANEGLAEWIAEAIIDADVAASKQRYANRLMRDGQQIGAYFQLPNIEAWQYGLSYGITTLMIRENRTGYRDFIHAIKDGTEWPEALAEHFGGVTPEGLVEVYKREQRISR